MNVVYGIGALGNANVFHNGQRFVFSDRNLALYSCFCCPKVRGCGRSTAADDDVDEDEEEDEDEAEEGDDDYEESLPACDHS